MADRVRALLVVCLLTALGAGVGEADDSRSSARLAATETSVADRSDVAVTIYRSDIALIRDTRKVTLPKGRHMLRFSDVAMRIKPETVSVRSVSAPNSVIVREQNYEYDLLEPKRVLEASVGGSVGLRDFTRRGEDAMVSPVKLLANRKGPVYEIDGRVFLRRSGEVVLPEVPAELVPTPSLTWELDGPGGPQTLETTYVTTGISWSAEYVVTIDRSEARANLEGWVVLRNGSGMEYLNAELKVVAGEINLAPRRKGMDEVSEDLLWCEGSEPMRRERFGDYYLYSLPHRTDVRCGEAKQVHLLAANGVAVKKTYFYSPHQMLDSRPAAQEFAGPERVPYSLEFENTESNHLGMPLPGGTLRIYQEDSSGTAQYAGMGFFNHTPANESVVSKIGQTFDVTAEQRQTRFARVGPHTFEATVETTVNNHKTADIDVYVEVPTDQGTTLIGSSHPDQMLKPAGGHQRCLLHVPKEERTTLILTLRHEDQSAQDTPKQ